MAEADQAEIDEVIARLTPKPAERAVPGWESDPPLLSDQTYTLGAGDETLTVTLPILSGDYYWSYLLPRVEEWATGIFDGDALAQLQAAAVNPLAFLYDLFRRLQRRPNADALKVSFYEACAYTLSNEAATVTPRFFAKCPPNQQLGVIRQVVAINHANFTEWLGGLPIPLLNVISLSRLMIIQSMQILSAQLTGHILEQRDLLLSGGAESTGTPDSSDSPAESSTASTPS